jgi:hypothetical protein
VLFLSRSKPPQVDALAANAALAAALGLPLAPGAGAPTMRLEFSGPLEEPLEALGWKTPIFLFWMENANTFRESFFFFGPQNSKRTVGLGRIVASHRRAPTSQIR